MIHGSSGGGSTVATGAIAPPNFGKGGLSPPSTRYDFVRYVVRTQLHARHTGGANKPFKSELYHMLKTIKMSNWKQTSIASLFQRTDAKCPRKEEGSKEVVNSSSECDPPYISDSEIPGSDLSDEESVQLNADSLCKASTSTSTGEQLSSTEQCSSECCDEDLREPYHPNISCIRTKRKQGKQSRSFQGVWFDEHKWLTFCVTRKKAYCYYCRTGAARGLINAGKCGAFVFVGFDNWKKAKERFREHERSQVHREACMKFQSLEQPSIAARLSNQVLKDQKQKREMLMKELTSLRYLARQGLAIRGHNEEDGNLRQLLKCRADDDQGIEFWLRDGRYLSHDIVNELLELMAHQLLRGLLQEIRQAEWFALIADETRDVSGMEQLAISLRWVDCNYVVYEDVIALADVEQTDAATLTDTLKDAVIRSGLQLTQCRGQAYDGASNMSGRISGVASRILKEEPKAHYVHCVAHSLNLCLQECGQKCVCIRDALVITSELGTLIRASPKRLAQFRCLREQLSPGSPGLKPLCPTRWSVRTGSIDAILKNYTVLYEELTQIAEDSLGEPSRKALGFQAVMERFATYFGLKLSHLVFAATEQLSLTLQYKDINAQEVSMAVSAAIRFLQTQRTDSAFDAFFHSTVKEAEAYTQEPMLPRQKSLPRRVNDGAPSHQYTSPHDYFRQQYYEVLDLMMNEINRRFDQ